MTGSPSRTVRAGRHGLPGAVATAALALLAGACAKQRQQESAKPLVVVSIFPVADLVAHVGGDAVRVETLLPPRASPATWEVAPAQVRALSRAKGYITVGGGLDGWLEDLAADRPGLRRLRLTEGMSLRQEEDEHGGGETGNPHVWLDPVLVRERLLPRIAGFLQALAPGDSAGIRKRAAAWADTLTRLDDEVRGILAAAPERGFVSTHDAWVYFAARYGLKSLGSIYERPGHEPSARSLARLVDLARASGVHAILAEPQLAGTAGRALAGELHAEVVVVDPLGGVGVPGRDSYTALLRSDALAFARALAARPGEGS